MNILSANIILAILLVVGIFFILAWLLQFLWNITMPQVFNLKTITFWQSFRLLLISGILFGGPNITL